MLDEKQLLYAYMAGFLDADGSISIVSLSQNKRYTVKVSITNCNQDVISLFSKEFGGKIRAKSGKKKNWNTCYEWSMTSNKALAIINTLYPFIKIKRGQADLAIELQALRAKMRKEGVHHRWHKDKWDLGQKKMLKIKEACMKLNKRGIS